MNKKIEFPDHQYLKEYHSNSRSSNGAVYLLTINGQTIECSAEDLNKIAQEYSKLIRAANHSFFADMAKREIPPFYTQEFKEQITKMMTAYPKEFSTEQVSKSLDLYYLPAVDLVENWKRENIVTGSRDRLSWLIKSTDELVEPIFTNLTQGKT